MAKNYQNLLMSILSQDSCQLFCCLNVNTSYSKEKYLPFLNNKLLSKIRKGLLFRKKWHDIQFLHFKEKANSFFNRVKQTVQKVGWGAVGIMPHDKIETFI